MPRTKKVDFPFLEAALAGLEQKRAEIERKMNELREMVGGTGAKQARGAKTASGTRKRTLSPAARRRIAAAQKKRWAEFRRARKAAQQGSRPRAGARTARTAQQASQEPAVSAAAPVSEG